MKPSWKFTLTILTAFLAVVPVLLAGGEERDAVSLRVGNDLYAAGGNVILDSHPGKGDIVAAGGRVVLSVPAPELAILAGGQVTVRQTVQSDALLAGGNIEVEAAVGDDVRAAGGTITLSAPIGGDLVAAGGELVVLPPAKVKGDASLAGGRITMQGGIGGHLRMEGDEIVLDGAVKGPVEVTAQSRFEIGPNAVVGGDLTYRSPEPALVDPKAKLSGKVEHLPLEQRYPGRWPEPWAAIGAVLLGAVGFGLVAVALMLIFPVFTRSALGTMNAQTGKSFVLGFALFFTLPAAAIVLMVTVIGAPLGVLLLLLIYPPALIGGWLLSAVRIGEWGLRLLGPVEDAPAGWRVVFALLGVLVLMLLAAIPYLGGLVCLVATTLGLGALTLAGWRRYQGEEGPPRGYAR